MNKLFLAGRPAVLSRLMSLCLVCMAVNSPKADPLANWHWRNPLPTGSSLNAITFANGRFVAVGSAGNVTISADGIAWSPGTSLTTNSLNGVVYGGGLFVAVGDNGTVQTSDDGTNWTLRAAATAISLKAIVYGNGTFVAVGEGGGIVGSPDGVNWSPRSSGGETGALIGVAYGNGVFVALVGALNAGNGKVLASQDTVSWTNVTYRTEPMYDYLTAPNQVVFGNGRFVIQAFYITPFIYTSSDGLTWDVGQQLFYTGLLFYGDGKFWLSDWASSSGQFSADGVTWSNQPLTGFTAGNSGTYGNGTFVVVGKGGTILKSVDGFSWANQVRGARNTLTSIAYGNGKYVLVSSDFSGGVATGTILVWSNGLSLGAPSVLLTNQSFAAVTYSSGTFTAIGSGGTMLQSDDGLTWTQAFSGTSANLYGITAGNGILVTVGDHGRIQTSPTGKIWTGRSSGIDYPLFGVAHGGGMYVAVGFAGALLTSNDGVSWSVQDSGQFTNLIAVTYGKTGFVAVGAQGIIITSTNGVNWTSQNSNVSSDLVGVSYGNGTFMTVGSGWFIWPPSFYSTGPAVILTSIDGVHWTSRNPSVEESGLLGSAFLDSRFVAVGANGTVLESDPITTTLLSLQLQRLGGATYLSISAPTGADFRLQGSPNLSPLDWLDLARFTNVVSTTEWKDPDTLSERRFYRAVSP